MTIAYMDYLLLFMAFNGITFLCVFKYPEGKTIIKVFMLFSILTSNMFLFFYLILHDFSLLEANFMYIFTILIITALTLFLTHFIKDEIKLQSFTIFTIAFIALVDIFLEYSLNITKGFTEIGEQIPDAAVHVTSSHWSFSLKNPFYDIINVASFWIAILHTMLGVNDIVHALPNMILYLVTALLILLAVYVVYRRMGFQSTALTAIILALATPYITLISVPPALSAVFAVLALTFFAKQDIKSSDYLVIATMSIAGVLTHPAAIAMIIFGPITLYLLTKLYRGGITVRFGILTLLITNYLVISFVRFFYTTAYVSLQPYYADFLKFLNFLSSPGNVELRVTRYEQWAPLFTSFSWTVFPALAASYVTGRLFKKRHNYSELLSLSLLVAGLGLILIGFAGARISNSFSREAAYPGYLLLLLGSFEPLRCVNNSKVGRAAMAVLIVMAVLSGLFTIKNAPWLYVGRVPYLTFMPPTPQEVQLSQNLLKLGDANSLSNLRLYQDFDQGIYAVKMIVWEWIKPNNISSLNVNVQPLRELGVSNTSDVIFNSGSLVALG
jgi:hypothetical protein